jgi:hypothetical protein
MYEFESYMNLNLKYLNIVVICMTLADFKPADTIDLSLISTGLS